MESARNDQNSGQNNDNIDNNVRLLTETEQSLTTTHGVADVLGSAHLGHQQDSSVAHGYAGGEGNSSIDFLASSATSGPQHHQPTSTHHSITSIPEDRTATVLAKHPASDNQKEGCSPDPVSAATTGTTSTPTSVAGSSSPPPVDAVTKAAGPPPDFHSDSIRSGAGGNMLQGQPHWPPPIGGGMIGTRYGAGPTNAVDNPDVGQYDLSPTEGGRYASSSFPCAIKLLVSNNVAGSIIGRAGQTISELQAQSSTRIKLSQTGDYYPGSQDRVCLVQGQLENVKGALSLLLERLYMLQEHQHTQHMAWQSNRTEGPPPFDFVVRILVPTSSCGMIIGKSGSNIRQMEEASGVASVRLSPKDIVDPNYPSSTITSATSERVVTLTGATLDCCLNCLFIILDGMTSHPDICRYTNMTTSYSRIMPDQSYGGGSPATLRGGPAPEAMHGPEWNPHYAQSQLSGLGKRVSSSPDLCGAFFNRPPMPLEPRPGPVGVHSGRDNVLYSPMFGGPAPPPSSYSPIRPQPTPRMPQSSGQPQPPMYLNHPVDSQGGPAPPVSNSASAPDLLALQLESMHLPASPPPPQQQPPPVAPVPPPTQGATHQDYPPFQSQSLGTGPVVTQQLMVPDNMIGSILGRGGRTLNELQVQSGTRIRISQRGEYMPGTRNRIVTIRGPNDHSVSLAQYLMSQRMILPRTATYQVPLGQSQSMATPGYSESGHIPLSQSPASMPPLAYSDDGPPPEHLPFYHAQHHTDSTVQHQHPHHHPQHHHHLHPHHSHPPHAPTNHHHHHHQLHHSQAHSSTSLHQGPMQQSRTSQPAPHTTGTTNDHSSAT